MIENRDKVYNYTLKVMEEIMRYVSVLAADKETRDPELYGVMQERNNRRLRQLFTSVGVLEEIYSKMRLDEDTERLKENGIIINP